MEEINVIEVLQYFKSKIKWILLAIVAVVLIGNVYTKLTRVPMYNSNTTIILVSSQTENLQGDLSLNNTLANTYAEMIKSRRVLEQVINNLKLKYSASQLASNVSLETKQGTSMFTISVNDSDGKRAKKIADELAKVFAQEVKNVYNLDNVKVYDEALVSKTPYNITYKKDNMMYVLIGLVLSCTVIFGFYYFDTTIKSTEIVEEKLGLTILGVIPEERKGR